MVKVLAVGDFHGKFTTKLYNKIKKEKPDIILSPGDFCGHPGLAKLFFKHYYGKDEKEVPKKYRKELKILEEEALSRGLESFSKLKSLDIMTFFIMGNWDPTPYGVDLGHPKNRKRELKKFDKEINNNFQRIDLSYREFDSFILIGGVSTTHPGMVDKKSLERLRTRTDKRKKGGADIKKMIKMTAFRQKKYEEMFKKAKKTKKPILFLTHNAPYDTMLDKIGQGSQKGEHYGSYLERKIIIRFKPNLVLCGHMHENFGKCKLGESVIVNSGTAQEGNYVTLEFDEAKKKFGKIRLVGK
jgi:Icc-related predicted phosphoesterase